MKPNVSACLEITCCLFHTYALHLMLSVFEWMSCNGVDEALDSLHQNLDVLCFGASVFVFFSNRSRHVISDEISDEIFHETEENFIPQKP